MCFEQVYMVFKINGNNESSPLELSLVTYQDPLLEQAFEDPVPLLSISEAEEELENGYIFLGHVCPICVSSQDKVDFSEHQGSEIVYRDSFYTHIIPYYAFYKQVDKGSVAVTYVPAVQVEGLEEYFQEQADFHSGQ